MPEVVEVCLTSLWLNDKLNGMKIKKINVLGGRYSRHPLKGKNYIEKYSPFTINKIDSKGKFLWFELTGKDGNSYYILNRFGLEGEWGFTKETHSGLEFEINDTKLYFTDSRSFGTVEIVNDKTKLDKELDKMGPDFLKTTFTNNEFYNRIEKYITNDTGKIVKARGDKEIIKVLMDQTIKGGIGSGLGNYLSVEALYNAKISPYKKISEIYKDKTLVNSLAASIKYIVKLSFLDASTGYLEHLDEGMASFIKKLRKDVNNNQNNQFNYHPDVVLKDSDKFSFKVYRQKKDPKGNPVQGDKIIPGRTTYWVPSVQT
ncbi:formamidopyrimidine-DNA glycosylase [Fadolivirus algeromassiliense]|jgi:formamidopyrimidine-DNA glycosylase|uniref:DNA-formamidopyrimidine glycosylase n=1 Tax=Fadolivirus FV1/VV64 TaxID=3070911 RepID=A0A7D3R0I8_9VIRU|nr:formamidopyrimidine-DNA glycosylase [Fadolivirus algeromassiliense]QKF93701.1 formamidopyrimidine-DNA glycosylase [Fadolivirus FV1/VV64]